MLAAAHGNSRLSECDVPANLLTPGQEYRQKLTEKKVHGSKDDILKLKQQTQAQGPWLKTAYAQIIILALACFAGPGMYNAISSLGSGLPGWDQSTSSAGNMTVSWTFAFFSIFAPSLLSLMGVRLTIFIGATGYIVFTLMTDIYASLDEQAGEGGTVAGLDKARYCFLAASAWLGICASLIWTAQGAVIMAYPVPEKKGQMVSLFWIIFNLGALMGSVWGFASNFDKDTPDSKGAGVSSGTYIGFMAIMCTALLLSMLLCPTSQVRRSDGSSCELKAPSSVSQECSKILAGFTDRKMLMLVPLFLYTNWCYTYQFNVYSTPLFDVRTRSYASGFYWGAQMLGAVALGYILDSPRAPLARRATTSFGLITLLGAASWGACFWVQAHYTPSSAHSPSLDLTDPRSLFPAALYTLFGLLDAGCQVWSYWLMSNLSSDPSTLARYSGFYKTMQSAGAALASQLNSVNQLSATAQLAVNAALFAAAVGPSYWLASSLVDDLDGGDDDSGEDGAGGFDLPAGAGSPRSSRLSRLSRSSLASGRGLHSRTPSHASFIDPCPLMSGGGGAGAHSQPLLGGDKDEEGGQGEWLSEENPIRASETLLI